MVKDSSLVWINEYPQLPEVSTVKLAHGSYTRRQHKKSRSGCQNCRQRRIKCDEVRPECGQCRHRRVVCQSQAGFSKKLNPSASNSHRNDSVSRDSINQILSYLEGAGVQDSEKFKNIISKQEDVRELLDHFVNTKINWLGSPDYQRIIQEGLSLAIEAPYLTHAILAMSASHLSRLKPGEKYNVAAAIHYQYALTTYSAQLGAPINSQNVDEIIGCGFLHTMLAFGNISRLSENQEVNSSGSKISATWLRAMQGMTILQRTKDISSHYTSSIWLPVFLESGGCEDVSCQHAEESDNTWASTTSKSLHSLCEVPIEFSCHNNLYHEPLKFLCGLMRLDASHKTVGRFIVFIGQLPADFVQLFEQNDTRAMLLMAYWCSMIGDIDQWWITDSAISECRRLCAILDRVSISQVRDLLRFPARKCGYILRE